MNPQSHRTAKRRYGLFTAAAIVATGIAAASAAHPALWRWPYAYAGAGNAFRNAAVAASALLTLGALAGAMRRSRSLWPTVAAVAATLPPLWVAASVGGVPAMRFVAVGAALAMTAATSASVGRMVRGRYLASEIAMGIWLLLVLGFPLAAYLLYDMTGQLVAPLLYISPAVLIERMASQDAALWPTAWLIAQATVWLAAAVAAGVIGPAASSAEEADA